MVLSHKNILGTSLLPWLVYVAVVAAVAVIASVVAVAIAVVVLVVVVAIPVHVFPDVPLYTGTPTP